MEANKNYELFCNQAGETLSAFPGLRISQDENGLLILKGILDIPNDFKKFIDSFLIEIHFSQKFPYRFPILFEIGGRIPDEADWHKFPDGSCCITVAPDEKFKCRNGITVKQFIQQYAIPYFANYTYKKITGKYKNGEYSHTNALEEYYTELLKTNDRTLWQNYFKHVFSDLKICCGRNELCFCRSGKKYKTCHLRIFRVMEDLGENQIISDFRTLSHDVFIYSFEDVKKYIDTDSGIKSDF